jgi:hypothetical protein
MGTLRNVGAQLDFLNETIISRNAQGPSRYVSGGVRRARDRRS